MTTNSVCVYDFTAPADRYSQEFVKAALTELAKSWAFQLEQAPSTGFLHYQGRMSLKMKKRESELLRILHSMDIMNWHISVTSSENRTNTFYVLKSDTRIEGPWKDDDEESFLPRQFRNLTPLPWQATCISMLETFEPRKVDCIVSPHGNEGKSTLAALMEIQQACIDMPPIRDPQQLMQLACNICKDRNMRSPKAFFIDLPRAMSKANIFGIFSAIEEIKKGKLYDCRYHYKAWWIDSPAVWVFTNAKPPLHALSADRWRFWRICPQTKQLIPVSESELEAMFAGMPTIPDDGWTPSRGPE